MANLTHDLPEWFEQVKDKTPKIVLLHSGRGGGGKTTALALYAVKKAIGKRTRIVMGREIQRSSKESNIQLVKDWLEHPKTMVACNGKKRRITPKDYSVTANEVRFSNGSQILFMGLSSSHGTSQAFQSTAGIDLLIVDEAQMLTIETCRKVFPTIREPGSKIILAYNPINPTDAVEQYRRLAKDPVKNTYPGPDGKPVSPYILDIPLTWRHNPHFQKTDLYAKMLYDKANFPDVYRHIWEGEYQDDEGYRIAHYVDAIRCYDDWDDVTMKRAMKDGDNVFGLDLALSERGDNTTLVITQGGVVTHAEKFRRGTSFTQTTRHLLEHDLPYRCYFDATGIGGGFRDVVAGKSDDLASVCKPIMFGAAPEGKKKLWDGKINNAQFFSSRRDQMYFALKNRIENTLAFLDKTREVDPADCLLLSPKYLTRTQAEELVGQIAQPAYSFTTRGHVRFDKMPEGEDSPDMLDALALAFCLDSVRGISNSMQRAGGAFKPTGLGLIDPVKAYFG